ncbi:MAG: FdtA/QdtA family cupin domain-containing protein [Hymenobacteraceae bacterium]|nr:FdtA/QdtA family cupin domain-containing protein [Hymenobacteraceae bacterium]MDX5397784.1 FdtA/QdtA family cupin domain-containing protein [Hymenobacteraceae bacterium]MDX5513860.1 FdtA/QdtA family cupin domain-containing protein [Hymenobacteraceae bacterium]
MMHSTPSSVLPGQPYLLHFPKFGNAATGFITTTQLSAAIPFAIKRVFWTYGMAGTAERGNHANRETEEVLVVVQGQVRVQTETAAGRREFVLNDPQTGLYIPAMCWTWLHFEPGTVVVCMTSTDYDEQDFIREYEVFMKIIAD